MLLADGGLRARNFDSFGDGDFDLLGDRRGQSNGDDLLLGDSRGDRLLLGDRDGLEYFHLFGNRGCDGNFFLDGDRRKDLDLFGDHGGLWRGAF